MDLTKKRCVPCEGGVPPLTEAEEDRYIKNVSSWTLIREGNHKITRDFKFSDFKKAMVFVNKVADLAENEGHHPDICISYNKVTLQLLTHAVAGLTENDFIMAAKIDQFLSKE
jgi:4a-hydroxytetrahydrobiopterin dehydratase